MQIFPITNDIIKVENKTVKNLKSWDDIGKLLDFYVYSNT